MSLKSLMSFYQQRVNVALEHWLPADNINPSRLHKAMRYSVFNGGKRVRPLLVYFTGEALGVSVEHLDAPACAVELIHAYSLVHDDLPAMDDDDLRRGKPTCHKAFDEATAILVGDGLQTLAFYTLSHQENLPISAERRLMMLDALTFASGSRGMVGGQMIDIEAMGKQINLVELENMHIHKTGALIRASVKLGALACAEASEDTINKLDHYAKCIGLAFQVKDDILDIEASTEVLGKAQGSDEAHDKPTYPSLMGLKQAKQMANDLLQDALDSLQGFDKKADPLREMAKYIVTREY
ncbi:(2E,6E)-farnesyl diphosphate synthase [Candidatus Albibeggiatoa sp. nov. NOAA]|uniref:(2E,6E)-farnesyl diphosphate synthase n=1 Tax=Candidatus Albibeggiatoa sp. nov. NOAA TaxID=3162724 RepID=UPI0032FF94B8|nr:(2E,6E)-farnesyl diphosphate synthase [Thiotrichaceae bacterium]